MKNLTKFIVITALVAVIGFSFASCASTGDGPKNRDPKGITITGITDPAYTAYKTSRAWLMVVPEGSVTGNNPFGKDVAYSVNPPDYIATLPANTLAFGLYKSGRDERWTGSGVYDLWLLEGNSTISAAYKYKASSIEISEASTTLDFSNFTKVE